MGVKNADHVTKEKGRVVANVPAVSGSYAEERITFGDQSTGLGEQSFMAVTALVESAVAAATLELWLPQVAQSVGEPASFTDANYYFTGKSLPASGGAALTNGQGIAETWTLAGYPGAQIRVKSGGIPGQMPISASAF